VTDYGDEIVVDGQPVRRYLISASSSSFYMNVPKIGTGRFKILHAYIEPPTTLIYPLPAKIVFTWKDGKGSEQEDILASGFVGANQALTLNDVEIVGPGVLSGWRSDATIIPWFGATYRRVMGWQP